MNPRLAVLLFLAACAAPRPQHAATIPAEHVDAAARNAVLVDRARSSDAQVVFLGDSITEGWEGAGKKPWADSIAPFGALDLGVGGDRTEHVLWRLQTGAYDHVPARIVVLLIGTNNLGTGQTPEMTADGVAAVVDDLLVRWPQCKVLLLAIFPRGAKPDDPLRLKVAETNPLLRDIADRGRLTWLDLGGLFLAPDGTLPSAIMPDALHLSEDGYGMEAVALKQQLTQMLKR